MPSKAVKTAVVVGAAGTAALLLAYVVSSQLKSQQIHAQGKGASSASSSKRSEKGKAAELDLMQQSRVFERVEQFLRKEKEHLQTQEELDALFDEAAGEDGRISLAEFRMVVRSPLMHSVSQLVRQTIENASLLVRKKSGISEGEDYDDGTLEVALKIQDGIPRIQAGIPQLSDSLFKALDKDSSGYLDKTEFHAAVSLFNCFSDPVWIKGQPTPEHLAQMRPAFNLLFQAADSDHNGHLNVIDAQNVLREASDFIFDFSTNVVKLVSESISGAFLGKFVALPFRKALQNLDADGDGQIAYSELKLEDVIGDIVGEFRGRMGPLITKTAAALEHDPDTPTFAQDLIQQQAVEDIVSGIAGAKDMLSLTEKARAGVSGGLSESTFVKCCVRAVQHRQHASLQVIETSVARANAPEMLMNIVRKLHGAVNPSSMQHRQVGLAAAQQKIFSAVYSLCDMNSDGVISWKEVQAWQEIQKAIVGDPSASNEKVAQAIFAIVDKNGDGQITRGEIEYLLQKIGNFGSVLAEGVLDFSKVLVRAGIDMLSDAEYQALMAESINADERFSPKQKQLAIDAFKAVSATVDPSSVSGDKSKMLALDAIPMHGLTADQAWTLLMATWPGAGKAARNQAKASPADI